MTSRYACMALLSLFAMNISSAGEPERTPNQQLQDVIELFTKHSQADALSQLQLGENSIVDAVRASNNAADYLLLGRAYFYAEMDAKAITALETALTLDPSLARAHFFIGLIHMYSADTAGAEQSMRRAIAIDNQDPDYFVELGHILTDKNDSDGAVKAYQYALALDETSFRANYNLATILAGQSDTAGAERHYLAALKQKPASIDANYNLGQLYQTAEQHSLAITQFEKVVALNPTDWQAMAKLVQENEALGQTEARDAAITQIYKVWNSKQRKDLNDQGFYVREQRRLKQGKLFVLEFFELQGERARKYVFKLQDEKTSLPKFEVSLGSYEATTKYARLKGSIKPNERVFHADGYTPNGSHFTYAFFYSQPPYETVRDIALKAFADQQKIISSTIVPDK